MSCKRVRESSWSGFREDKRLGVGEGCETRRKERKGVLVRNNRMIVPKNKEVLAGDVFEK